MSSSNGQALSEEEMSIAVLPNELVTKILTRLPGKQVGRCKCVCKLWQTIIRGRMFMDTYRKHQSGLVFYWWENVQREDEDNGFPMRRFHFFHCPLRHPEELPEEFTPLPEVKLALMVRHGRGLSAVSQLVHGLLCVGEGEPSIAKNFRLTIHNIFTGETMRLPNPDPLPCEEHYSTYHLGYDPVSRVYKILRLIFNLGGLLMHRALIMTLRPPSRSPSKWRELDFNSAGICHFHLASCSSLSEIRTSHVDGMMCWIKRAREEKVRDRLCWIRTCREEKVCDRLLCFDLNMEMFHLIDCPERDMASRLSALTRFNDRIALWIVSHGKDDHKVNGISCYVQEDDEGKKWSKHPVKFLNELMESGGFAVVSGDNISYSYYSGSMPIVKEPAEYNLCFSSSGEILVENPDESWRVYSCSHQDASKKDVLSVGKFPNGVAPKLDWYILIYRWSNARRWRLSNGKLTRLMEGNNLYLPLDDIFGGGCGHTAIV